MASFRFMHALWVTAMLCLCGVIAAQNVDRVTINVDNPRPLKEAADTLETIYNVPINYEDPKFEWAGDIEDITDKVQNAQQRDAHPSVRILIPRGGVLTMSVIEPVIAAVSDVIGALSTLESQYESKGYPGRFDIQQASNLARVKPIAIRSRTGEWKPSLAVMSSPVSFSGEERSAAAVLALIAKELTDRTGSRVGVGRFPVNAFANATVTFGVNDEPADTVLIRLFDQVSASYSGMIQGRGIYSYRLLYDPGVRRYFLHVNTIAPRGVPAEPQQQLARPPKGFLMDIPAMGRPKNKFTD